MNELCPAERSAAPTSALVDSSLDKLVLSMSQDLIDDFPASDPRWMESVPASEAAELEGSASSQATSLLILHQLEDKQTALEFYINFLQEVGLWKQVGGIICFVIVMKCHEKVF